MSLLRPIYESWLFQATQDGLAPWQRALLARALRKDAALRSLALELAEFNADQPPASEEAPDVRARLRAQLFAETAPPLEKPLFPSAWVPAGAIAVLLITAGVALTISPPKPAPVESSAANTQIAKDLAQDGARPGGLAPSSQAKSFLALTAPAGTDLSRTTVVDPSAPSLDRARPAP